MKKMRYKITFSGSLQDLYWTYYDTKATPLIDTDETGTPPIKEFFLRKMTKEESYDATCSTYKYGDYTRHKKLVSEMEIKLNKALSTKLGKIIHNL